MMEIAEFCKNLVVNIFWFVLAIIAVRVLVGVILAAIRKFIQIIGGE